MPPGGAWGLSRCTPSACPWMARVGSIEKLLDRAIPGRRRWRTSPVAVDPPYARTDDVGLVIAIARYNGDAFAEAFRRHAGAVFGLAHRLLWERALAEEMVQEIFLRLWEHPDRFDQARGSL